ncbi:MAG: D-aminoacyl-tRNA deacylase [Proteobacteria bacterium]|jgi:D-aminoacyl-tRNA deacylase|nr:D-tyrosyl-tRNA(Tyr) deacylase [Pseudomonadales bacterium]MDA0805775.1 D-aminoacyl-tRNA deacylase [Pseudomonadota bacterium]MDA0897541.1 D-aminoacyl-tRNA deacylase [Pseudomonadota bacterium]MDA1244286.1 D-aminoacyl-tRNA deacylase [Pseudomonadota bacterium]
MICLIQRVRSSQLHIKGALHAEIGQGLLALVGIEKEDTEVNLARMLDKLYAYRVFSDSEGKMNLSVKDIDGQVLLVSQFTLAAETQKGLRPGFSSAMPPSLAQPLFETMVSLARQRHSKTESGLFGADMQISLLNDGPVTFILRA